MEYSSGGGDTGRCCLFARPAKDTRRSGCSREAGGYLLSNTTCHCWVSTGVGENQTYPLGLAKSVLDFGPSLRYTVAASDIPMEETYLSAVVKAIFGGRFWA